MTQEIKTKEISTPVILAIFILISAAAGIFYFIIRPEPPPKLTGQTKEFNVIAKSYSFTPSDIRVNNGDKVKLNVFIADGFHDFVIDEFTGARTERTSAVATTTIEFIVNKTGEFKYYCSVGNHRQLGMEGILIVEANQ